MRACRFSLSSSPGRAVHPSPRVLSRAHHNTICCWRKTVHVVIRFLHLTVRLFFAGVPKKVPTEHGLVALSGVGFNSSQSQAVFFIDHFCGLCGGGRYVLMEKVSGVWHVRDEHYIWIS